MKRDPYPQRVSQIQDPNLRLSETDRKHLAMAINLYGTGDHPMATGPSISYFALDYALKCALDMIEEMSKHIEKAA